jgi:hypothetical protein
MKKLTQLALAVLLSFTCAVSFAQDKSDKSHGIIFRAAFYNVENLFDTIDDPQKDDADFLPGSRIAWTSQRYNTKIEHTGEVIAALAGDQPAAIIGLCEIENDAVIGDLIHSPKLLPYGYSAIQFDSPDERGIENVLIYDEDQFRPVFFKPIRVDISSVNDDHTRDILYVKGYCPKAKKDTLHIFVNHWPSRSEGKEVSEPKRMVAAQTLKHVTDSLMALASHPLILIMGDLNDEPSDKSISEGLGAQAPAGSFEGTKLYNLGFPPYQQGKGTLFYKDWDLFDQIIVNGGFLLNSKGLTITAPEESIFSPDWLLYKSNDGTSRPNRTAAKDYYGGYSDHLPVYLDMMIKK